MGLSSSCTLLYGCSWKRYWLERCADGLNASVPPCVKRPALNFCAILLENILRLANFPARRKSSSTLTVMSTILSVLFFLINNLERPGILANQNCFIYNSIITCHKRWDSTVSYDASFSFQTFLHDDVYLFGSLT